MLIPEPRFYLKDCKSSEPTIIYIQARYSINDQPQRVTVSSNDKIIPSEWDPIKQRAITNKRSVANSEINIYLDKMASCFKSIMRNLAIDNIIPLAPIVKDKLEEALNLKAKVDVPKITLYNFISAYINESKSNKSQATIKAYTSTLNRLKEYGEHCNKVFTFDDITLEWRFRFLTYLQDTYNISKNTEGKYIKNIKCFLNEATERNLNKNLVFQRKSFFKPMEAVHKIFLTMDEIERIANLDLRDDKLKEIVRDYFIIGCLTALRFSDLTRLRKEFFQNDRIQMITQKTGEEVIIPISPLVRKVLVKYDYHLPKAPCNQVFNRYLKDIGEQADLHEKVTITKTIGGVTKTSIFSKYQLLSSHTARRSLISNCILEGINSSSIMLISGHRSHKVFSSYVRINQHQNADVLSNHTFFN